MKKILKNKFFISILTLTSGTVLAQVISFLASPLMTRLFTSEEIGLATLIMTAVTMFGNIVGGRYELSIIYEKDENDLLALIKLSLRLTFILSIILSFAYSLFYSITKDNSFWFYFISISILLILFGINNIFLSYNNRNQRYTNISKSSISHTFFRETSMIGFGFLNSGFIGLVLSKIVGQFMAIVVQGKDVYGKIAEIKNVSDYDVKKVMRKHYKQPLYSVPSIFANSFSYSSLNIFIEMLYGASTLGYYSISYRILGIPLSLVSNNVSKVYLEEANKQFNNENNYSRTFLRTSLFLFIVSLCMVLFLILFSPVLFSWFFGPEWEVAGSYVQILAPMFGFRLIVSSLTSGTMISNKQQIELKVQSLFIVFSLVSVFVANIFNFEVSTYLLCISCGYSIIYIIYFIILFKLSQNN